jgi:hypothetical protein
VQGLGVTGLESNHLVSGSDEKCLIYLVEGANQNFLYATDSSWLLKSTWLHLQEKKLLPEGLIPAYDGMSVVLK